MKHIHFIGICGVAMSALAIAFHKKGWKVTGSDVGFYPPISDHLTKHKIKFYPGWHPEKMMKDGAPDIVVVGNVAGSTNPELFAARENNINYKSYPEVVAEYIVQDHSVVCAGTYGKTSSTALLTWILKKCGYDPSYMFGGLSVNIPESAEIKANGSRAGWSVLEGDEYKTARWDERPKFKLYSPTHLLLTAASWDHADLYPTEKSYLQAFRDLLAMIPKKGLAICCNDGANIVKLINESHAKANLITYGKKNAGYVYGKIVQSPDGMSLEIKHGRNAYEIKTKIIGAHNAENVCGCFALANEIGINKEKIIAAIAGFEGIRRRLEKRVQGKFTVYDDLAHSPAKARATLKTLRHIYPESRIFAIFEPNTGNRRPQSAPGYDRAFKDADTVIIGALTKLKIDIWDADKPFEGADLARIISKTHKKTVFIEDDKKLVEYINKKTRPHDVVVFLGSHGFRGMIEKIAEMARE